ncbi:MAG: ATP12 family protein [Bdellovibrionales bacterium]
MQKKKREYTAPVYTIIESEKGWLVRRNERSLMTPKGTPYLVPKEGLAEAIAVEWRGQKDKIVPATMPLTQLAATALDVMIEVRPRVIQSLIAYTRSELLCHRAERPEELVLQQEKEWQPLLDWCESEIGLRLFPTTGIMPVAPSEESIAALQNRLETYDDYALTGLQQAADVSGSLVLGLALCAGRISAQETLALSEMDVLQQHQRWGADPVTEARHKAVLFDLEAVERFIRIVG